MWSLDNWHILLNSHNHYADALWNRYGPWWNPLLLFFQTILWVSRLVSLYSISKVADKFIYMKQLVRLCVLSGNRVATLRLSEIPCIFRLCNFSPVFLKCSILICSTILICKWPPPLHCSYPFLCFITYQVSHVKLRNWHKCVGTAWTWWLTVCGGNAEQSEARKKIGVHQSMKGQFTIKY